MKRALERLSAKDSEDRSAHIRRACAMYLDHVSAGWRDVDIETHLGPSGAWTSTAEHRDA